LFSRKTAKPQNRSNIFLEIENPFAKPFPHAMVAGLAIAGLKSFSVNFFPQKPQNDILKIDIENTIQEYISTVRPDKKEEMTRT
jgi:hypothetical protein